MFLDIWTARLDVDDASVDGYRSTLDPRELARVDRLRRDVDKRDYIVSHGILRSILSTYAESSAANIEFTYGPFGKPYIGEASPSPQPPPLLREGDKDYRPTPSPSLKGREHGRIEFNMSDSGGMLLVAVARGVAVGVDIEKRRPIEIVKFARRFFTPGEADALEALPETDREEAFFRTWTCKEAYVKGWGYGIQRLVGQFEVRVGQSTSGLTSCAFDEIAPARWSLVNVEGIDGFAATVAVERPGVDEVRLQWWDKSKEF